METTDTAGREFQQSHLSEWEVKFQCFNMTLVIT